MMRPPPDNRAAVAVKLCLIPDLDDPCTRNFEYNIGKCVCVTDTCDCYNWLSAHSGAPCANFSVKVGQPFLTETWQVGLTPEITAVPKYIVGYQNLRHMFRSGSSTPLDDLLSYEHQCSIATPGPTPEPCRIEMTVNFLWMSAVRENVDSGVAIVVFGCGFVLFILGVVLYVICSAKEDEDEHDFGLS